MAEQEVDLGMMYDAAKETADALGKPVEIPDPYTLLSRINSLETKIDKIISGEAPANVQLTGSNIDQRGLAANRPSASGVGVGVTYWSVDTGAVEVSDGIKWVVI